MIKNKTLIILPDSGRYPGVNRRLKSTTEKRSINEAFNCQKPRRPQSFWPRVIMSSGLETWQRYSRESCRVSPVLSLLFVLITASCLRWDPAEEISGIPRLPPHPDIQAFCLGASGGPTQEAKAHPLTLSKQREETGPEGAEERYGRKKINAKKQTQTHLHKHAR